MISVNFNRIIGEEIFPDLLSLISGDSVAGDKGVFIEGGDATDFLGFTGEVETTLSFKLKSSLSSSSVLITLR